MVAELPPGTASIKSDRCAREPFAVSLPLRGGPSPGDARYGGRNVELDIVKGFLVLVMLFYHCASVGDLASLHMILRKIDFIHYAFLMIVGFLCGHHYYPVADSTRGKVRARLWSRSAKIFLVFLAGNAAYYALGFGHLDPGRIPHWSDMPVVLRNLLFRIPDANVAFEILYLISAFLLTAGLVIGFSWTRWFLLGVIFLPVVVDSMPLLFTALASAGMLVGILAKDGYLAFLGRWIPRYLWVFPLVLTVILVFVPTPERWHMGTKGLLLFFLLATPIWLLAGLWAIEQTRSQHVQRQAVLLGRYTMLAYILQTVFAQISFRILHQAGLRDPTYYGLSLLIVGGTMWLVILVVERMRLSSALWNRAYQAVFQ